MSRSLDYKRGLLAMAALAAGCMNGPYDGDVVGGSTLGASFQFSGYYDSPNIPITIQVLDSPDSSPHWVTLATTTTASSPSGSYPSGDNYFQFSVNATPAPTSALLERFPQGGMFRSRAVANDPNGHGSNYLLAIADEDQDACFQANESDDWQAIAIVDCGKDATYGAAVASNNPTPADTFTGHTPPNYLSYLQYTGPGNPTDQQKETQAYYGIINAPPDLTSFRSTYGFNNGTEVVTTYYNDGDLGIGREMHCVEVSSTNISCYVRNFAPKDGSGNVIFGDFADSLSLAEQGTSPFATVAMHYNGSVTQTNGVQFMVYGPDNQLKADKAVLDVKAANTDIPGNCLTCHGGKATYDPTTHSIKSTNGTPHFLPFDVFNSLKYDSSGNYTYANQADKFRQLNAIVYDAGASPAISDYLNNATNGMYNGHIHTSGQAATNNYVPANWQNDATTEKLYTSAVAPYCRTCHTAMTTATNGHTALDFTYWSDFSGLATTIVPYVCNNHLMPNSEHTTRNFWNSPARAHLTGKLGMFNSCNPN